MIHKIQPTLDDFFIEAIEVKGPHRRRLLERVRVDRPDLVGELERLLSRYDTFDRELECGPVLPLGWSVSGGEVLPRSFQNYNLLEKIGEGGMGTVYLARQEEPCRQVALKLMHRGQGGHRFVARLRSEIRVLARMNHDSIARLYEAGTSSDGEPFFTMEFVPGMPITDFCRTKRQSLSEKLTLFLQVCEGVGHAHQKAVIHRDLKPANLLVTDTAGRPRVKIIDFGIARAESGSGLPQDHLTQAGQMLGTPAFMSPEQLDGNREVDIRGDIYALGCVLYELLAGLPPHDADTLAGKPLLEQLQYYRHQDPVPPSERLRAASGTSGEVRELARDLDWIVLKAMEKDVTRRYSGVFELKDDIARFLAGRPIQARPASLVYRATKTIRRYKVAFTAAAVVITALLASLVFTSYSAVREQRAHAETQRALHNFQAVNNFLENMLVAPNPKVGDRQVRVIDVLAQAERELEWGAMAADGKLLAPVHTTLGNTYFGLGRYREAHRHLSAAERLRERMLGQNHPETLKTAFYLARVTMNRGDYAETERILARTIEQQNRLLGERHPDVLQSKAVRAMNWIYLGRYEPARASFSETHQRLGEAYGQHHPEAVKALVGLATANYHLRNFEVAEGYYREALADQRILPGPEHPNTLAGMHNLANCLRALKRHEEARQLYEETLLMRQKVLGNEHPSTVGTRYGLARCLLAMRENDAAAEQLAVVYQARTKQEGACHAKTLRAANLLATLHGDDGRPEVAASLLTECLAACRTGNGLDQLQALKAMNNLGHYLKTMGQFERARDILVEALALERRVGEEKLHLNLLLTTAETYERLQDTSNATSHYVLVHRRSRQFFAGSELAAEYGLLAAEGLVRVDARQPATLMLRELQNEVMAGGHDLAIRALLQNLERPGGGSALDVAPVARSF